MQVHLLTVVSTTLSCCSKEKQSKKLIKQKEMEYQCSGQRSRLFQFGNQTSEISQVVS